ncbi:MAG: hypothetical protein ACMG55_10345, partial [Microcoleus sp.]
AADISANGKEIAKIGDLVTDEVAEAIIANKITEVTYRSALTCESKYGVCRFRRADRGCHDCPAAAAVKQ